MTKNELYERFAGEEMGDKELIATPATTLLINEEGSFSAQTLDKHLMGRLSLPAVVMLMLKCRQSRCTACPAAGSANTLQGWAPSPVAPLPSLPHGNPFQPCLLRGRRGVQGALGEGLTASLGSLFSHCKVRREAAPSHSSHTNEPQQVAG